MNKIGFHVERRPVAKMLFLWPGVQTGQTQRQLHTRIGLLYEQLPAV